MGSYTLVVVVQTAAGFQAARSSGPESLPSPPQPASLQVDRLYRWRGHGAFWSGGYFAKDLASHDRQNARANNTYGKRLLPRSDGRWKFPICE